MKTSIRRQIYKAIFLFILIFLICAILYNQTRQINIRAISLDIKWVQFINASGKPISRRSNNQIKTYWNELGPTSMRVCLQDGREFFIHYFHSDVGHRRRVLIEVNVNSQKNTASICLFYNGKKVAIGNYQLTQIIDKTVDLMILNKTPNKIAPK